MKRFMILLITAAMVTLTALPALALPKDKYDPMGPELSSAKFKETLAKEKYAWVMYTDSSPVVPENIKKQGEEFWDALKEKYQNQVKVFIKIDTNGWPKKAWEARKEIGTNTYPSFALYENGHVMNVGTMYAVIVNGAPRKEQYQEIFDYIKEVSFLK